MSPAISGAFHGAGNSNTPCKTTKITTSLNYDNLGENRWKLAEFRTWSSRVGALYRSR